MNTSVLKVKSVSQAQEAQNGNGRYQIITVQEYRLITVGARTIEAITNKVITRNLWSERKMKEGDGVVKADALFGTVKEGDYVAGSIDKFNTSEYDIDGKKVTSYTALIFDGENGVSYVNNQLKDKNACVVDEDGNLTVTLTANLKHQPQ